MIRIEILNKSEAIRFFPQIVKLLRSVWPSSNPEDTFEKDLEKFTNLNTGDFEKNIICFDDNEITGFTRIFKREIIIGDNRLNNMALTNVCVKKEYRGNGIGRQVVQNAFSFVDNSEFVCSVFQTRVPDFYLKLGAKIIHNEVINSQDLPENPFWDPFIIIYPGSFETSNGRIILNGKGY